LAFGNPIGVISFNSLDGEIGKILGSTLHDIKKITQIITAISLILTSMI
jgi:hypothetical protein